VLKKWFFRHSRESGSPDSLEDTGFLLEFTPYLSIRPDHGIRGRNDRKK